MLVRGRFPEKGPDLIAFDAGAKYGFHPNANHARRTNHHVFSLDILYGYGDEVMRPRLGHQLAAVPLLKILDAGEPNFLPVSSLDQQMDHILGGSAGILTAGPLFCGGILCRLTWVNITCHSLAISPTVPCDQLRLNLPIFSKKIRSGKQIKPLQMGFHQPRQGFMQVRLVLKQQSVLTWQIKGKVSQQIRPFHLGE